MNRLNNNSSRYNYKIDLKYNNIKFNNNKLEKFYYPLKIIIYFLHLLYI